MARELKNKPLVEAILEIKWKLQESSPGMPQLDPHYKLLLGRLFDRLSEKYPEHEQLPTASVPDEFASYNIQHRFRSAANSWPLVQVGPGIFAVNSTSDYIWSDFRPRVLSAIETLFSAHPKAESLKIINLSLRYIDAVDFDPKTDNTFNFLSKLKIKTSLPETLFQDTGIESNPTSFKWQSSFKCQAPKGLIKIGVATGQKDNVPSLIWETIVDSTSDDDLPKKPEDFGKWLDAAHNIADDWFFKMIDGELKKRFSNE